jgi:hypothetical protein
LTKAKAAKLATASATKALVFSARLESLMTACATMASTAALMPKNSPSTHASPVPMT